MVHAALARREHLYGFMQDINSPRIGVDDIAHIEVLDFLLSLAGGVATDPKGNGFAVATYTPRAGRCLVNLDGSVWPLMLDDGTPYPTMGYAYWRSTGGGS